MEQDGLWRLFFLTGLPEAYLAIRGLAGEEREGDWLPALTAFRPRPPERRKS